MQPTAKPNSNNKVSYKYVWENICARYLQLVNLLQDLGERQIGIKFKFRTRVSIENKTEY